MQTGTREYLGRNKFWTPSNIAITQSIVDSSIANISLNDSNSSELFSVTSDNSAIQTNGNVPLQASQFIITGTNAEIDEDENNAVNKRYLVDKITPLDNKFMTQTQCDARYLQKDITSLTLDKIIINKDNETFHFSSSMKTGNVNPYLDIGYQIMPDMIGNIISIGSSVVYSLNPILPASGINFNGSVANINTALNTKLPVTNLKGIVTSEITASQLEEFGRLNYLNMICPTYQYCENTYAKKSDTGGTSATINTYMIFESQNIPLTFTQDTKEIFKVNFGSIYGDTGETYFPVFENSDYNKFYVYDFDLYFTIINSSENTSIVSLGQLIKSMYFDFTTEEKYMVDFTRGSNRYTCRLTFTAMGTFRPIHGILNMVPIDNISDCVSADITFNTNFNLTIKCKEI